ncbi:hypothetical protein [Scytonema sp. NUACC26]
MNVGDSWYDLYDQYVIIAIGVHEIVVGRNNEVFVTNYHDECFCSFR